MCDNSLPVFKVGQRLKHNEGAVVEVTGIAGGMVYTKIISGEINPCIRNFQAPHTTGAFVYKEYTILPEEKRKYKLDEVWYSRSTGLCFVVVQPIAGEVASEWCEYIGMIPAPKVMVGDTYKDGNGDQLVVQAVSGTGVVLSQTHAYSLEQFNKYFKKA